LKSTSKEQIKSHWIITLTEKRKEEIEWLFLSAEKANYNLIRVWGGGMYMDDNFYELADKHGMLIWQDMMFSCRFYPFLEESFVQTAKIEVRE